MKMVDAIKDAISGRGRLVAELEALERAHAAAGAERARALVAAQAEVDAIEEPRRRLDRLRAESAALSGREERQRARVEQQLRAQPSRELAKFGALITRLSEKARNTPPPSVVERYDPILERRSISNIDECTRWLGVGRTLAAMRLELRDSLSTLPDDQLRERLAQLRASLEGALAGTALEHEIG